MSLFLLLFLLKSHLPYFWAVGRVESLKAGNLSEIADVDQTEKTLPLDTCETAVCQHVCELVFGVHVFDLNF